MYYLLGWDKGLNIQWEWLAGKEGWSSAILKLSRDN